jgi:hypothetical protein
MTGCLSGRFFKFENKMALHHSKCWMTSSHHWMQSDMRCTTAFWSYWRSYLGHIG